MAAMMIESPYTVPRAPMYRMVMKATHGKEELIATGKDIVALLDLGEQLLRIGYHFDHLKRDG